MFAKSENQNRMAAHSTGSIIVAQILAAPGYRQRLRRIRALAPSLCHGLAKKLADHALTEIRREPGEAIQCARLGAKAALLREDVPGLVACLRAEARAEFVSGEIPRARLALSRAEMVSRESEDDASRRQFVPRSPCAI